MRSQVGHILNHAFRSKPSEGMASQCRRMPLAALPSLQTLQSSAQAPLLFDIVSVQNWMRRRFPIYATFAGGVQMDRCVLRSGVAFDFISFPRANCVCGKDENNCVRLGKCRIYRDNDGRVFRHAAVVARHALPSVSSGAANRSSLA